MLRFIDTASIGHHKNLYTHSVLIARAYVYLFSCQILRCFSSLTGAQDMLRYISAMIRTGSVPASPAVQKAPSKGVAGMSGTEMHTKGIFGRVEPTYGQVGASYVEAGGKVEPTFTGSPCVIWSLLVLSDE